MDTTNEQGRGRRVPPYPSVTLPDSGYTVEARRIGIDALQQIRITAQREILKPTVPIVETELGSEENPADPDYKQALADWEDAVSTRAGHKLFDLIANYAILTPTDTDAVTELRQACSTVGAELPSDDRSVFVWSIVAPTERDHMALIAFVIGKSLPDEAAVQAQRDTFRGDVVGT